MNLVTFNPHIWYHVVGSLWAIGMFLALFLLCWYNKLPRVEALRQFVELFNTKGGNILLLFAGTCFSIFLTVNWLYWLIDLAARKAITPDNVYAVSGIGFLTGTMTGGFMSTLFKSMDGSAPKPEEKKQP